MRTIAKFSAIYSPIQGLMRMVLPYIISYSLLVSASSSYAQAQANLIEALKSGDPEIRLEAVRRLDESGESGSAYQLIGMLKDRYFRIRREAVIALGEIGARDAIDILSNCLRWRETEINKAAAWALIKIDKELGERQIKMSFSFAEDEEFRNYALELMQVELAGREY